MTHPLDPKALEAAARAQTDKVRKSASVGHALWEAFYVIVGPLAFVSATTLALGRADMTTLAVGVCAPLAAFWIYIRVREFCVARAYLDALAREKK